MQFVRSVLLRLVFGADFAFYKDGCANDRSPCGVANKVDRREACSDKSAEKRYAVKTENINNIYLLQKFDRKRKYHNSERSGEAV